MSDFTAFSGPIATLFAVEVLEGSVIIGQYRTVLMRSPEWRGEERQKEGLRCITRSALCAALLALVICAAIAIPLGILQKDLDPMVGDVIEGASKCVAAFCILLLSLKIPTWLEVYPRTGKQKKVGLTLKEIRFNVSWNIWREVAEIGIFLIPFILGSGAGAIPLSAAVGISIGLLAGGLIYLGNKRLKNKKYLAIFMCLLLVFVSAGLATGGAHEFEQVFGYTPIVWEAGEFWSSKKLPMILLKPFGYSSPRTVVQMCVFWGWLLLATILHIFKYRRVLKHRSEAREAEEEEEEDDVDGSKGDPQEEETGDTSDADITSEWSSRSNSFSQDRKENEEAVAENDIEMADAQSTPLR